MNARVDQRLVVPFEFPVIFTDHVFSPDNAALHSALNRLGEGRPPRAMLYVDAGAEAGTPGLAAAAAAWCRNWNVPLAAPARIVPGGEAVKNDWPVAQALVQEMLDLRLDRHACVIIVGGGALLDAVGFAASLVHRGLRVVRVPTTALAQCDGAVGVKTGINFGGGKNAIGTFAPPFAVLNDFQFLPTLADREWRGGVSEAFKVAIIRDRPFFDFLCENSSAFRERRHGPMRHLVQRCAELHLEHIRTGGDPFEMGRARPLDFGHWSAHKLELLSNFRIGHGDAVAAGVALDSAYAALQGWIREEDFQRIHRVLSQAGFPLWYPEMGDPALLDGLREFQEHLGGELCVTFPNGLGQRREENEVEGAGVRVALKSLHAMAGENPKSEIRNPNFPRCP
jgi:3-dehydroquinate synthase